MEIRNGKEITESNYGKYTVIVPFDIYLLKKIK